MPLTPPQIRAAELLAKGHSQQETADLIGVSRRTVVRWLKVEDFKHLSYGLVGHTSSPQKPPQSSPERNRQCSPLTPQDLVWDALEAVRDILQNPDSRNVDRLKAAALVGSWTGLGDREKMHELEALRVLIDAGWLPAHVLHGVAEAAASFTQMAKEVFGTNDGKAR